MSGGVRPSPPWAALALVTALAAVFVLETHYAIEPLGPLLAASPKTLLAQGAASGRLILQEGEWHRLITAALLHADLSHLAVNAVALLAAGAVLEPLVGRAWFLLLFTSGAISGSVAGLILNPPEAVSVGASGAVMAQLAALLVLRPGRPDVWHPWLWLATITLLALVPLPLGVTGRVDIAAHVGGAFAGTLMAVPLAQARRRQRRPPWQAGAMLAATLSMTLFAGAGLLTARNHHGYRLAVQLIPNDALPKTDQEALTQADQLVAQYPRDPRARLMQGRARLGRDDLAGAEATLRAGLAEAEILNTMFSRETEWRLRALLASVRAEQGDRDEARRLVRDICLNGGASPLRLLLTTEGYCAPSSLQ